MVKYQDAHAGPHLCGACRSDPPRAAGAARQAGEPFGQRARAAVCDVAARDHEASRRAVGCRPDRAREDRPHGRVPADRAADGAGDGLAQPLRALLVRQSRPSCRFLEEEAWAQRNPAAAGLAARPSLTLTRRLKRQPGQSLRRVDRPGKTSPLVRPRRRQARTIRAEIDVRVGGRYRISFDTEQASIPKSAASIARWCRTRAGVQLGLAFDARSASRW